MTEIDSARFGSGDGELLEDPVEGTPFACAAGSSCCAESVGDPMRRADSCGTHVGSVRCYNRSGDEVGEGCVGKCAAANAPSTSIKCRWTCQCWPESRRMSAEPSLETLEALVHGKVQYEQVSRAPPVSGLRYIIEDAARTGM